ncbi:MAG TPA: LptF/LptG family permease [Candidatus Ornithospirochaeta stercorigallinarum]|nr:LptF/LptG family permease [Candidatus Ornithospirochaeta stercorigallinarum]
MVLRRGSNILNRFISKEFLINFLVAFTFFFLIFFVNSILLLVQRILLKNIDFKTMLVMVLLSMPQFLIYTFPFATLTGASMVLGDLSSNNELLALKSSGVSERKVFLPIIIWSIIFSLITFFVSDYLLPWTNIIYRERLTLLMREMPTFEIEANGTNTVGNIVIANKEVEDALIHEIVMTNNDRTSENKTVVSKLGKVEMMDSARFIYRFTLEDPEILITDSSDINTNLLANAENATFYLDFSDQVPSLTNTDPVNLSSSVLRENIKSRQVREDEDRRAFYHQREELGLSYSSILKEKMVDGTEAMEESIGINQELMRLDEPPIDFYAQYYKAELTKKYSLSLACFFLTLVALPLGTLKLKYGKLTGFAISLIIAVAYWYMMFFAQLEIFNIKSPPYLLIFLPDIAVALIAVFFKLTIRGGR